MNREAVQRSWGKLKASVGARLGKSVLLPVCAFGALTMLAACVETKVVVVKEEVPRCNLQNFDGGRAFRVDALGIPDSNFDVGEPLRLQMRVSADAYMSVYYVSSSCKVARLLNNRPIKATEFVDFPTPESGLAMTVKPPEGEEAFYFIATREPIDFLSGGTGGDILGQGAGVSALDLSPAQFYRRLGEARGRINPDDWSARTLRTRVVAR